MAGSGRLPFMVTSWLSPIKERSSFPWNSQAVASRRHSTLLLLAIRPRYKTQATLRPGLSAQSACRLRRAGRACQQASITSGQSSANRQRSRCEELPTATSASGATARSSFHCLFGSGTCGVYGVEAGENGSVDYCSGCQSTLVRGSSASRRPSPMKLMASTVTKIATPGGNHSHQKFSSI